MSATDAHRRKSRRRLARAALLAAAALAAPWLHAPAALAAGAPPPAAGQGRLSQPVDLVIALDVSGSMSGLIDSARQRLWDVVNDLGQLTPQADLRVAVLSYGRPGYGRRSGYVRVDVPLTRDLDAVNAALFALGTGGGKEYVARVVHRALDDLDWSGDPDALRIVFVAGNESAEQDPRLSVDAVVRDARRRDVVVNVVYCGTDAQDPVSLGWRRVASVSGGQYASIDQDAARVAAVATPYDDRLRALDAELNRTYVPYGAEGERARDNQARQDRNAASMSAPASASRTVSKASSLYRAGSWDLVDALESGVALESVAPRDLPEEMQAMDTHERAAHVARKAGERAAIREEIARLGAAREAYIAEAARERAAADGLDDALKQGLRRAAEAKGFRFE